MCVTVVLFDLDGTLVHSGAGIAGAAGRALAEFGRPPLTADELSKFVGPPLRDSFVELGVAGEEVDGLVAAYRRHYLADGLLDFQVVPDVPALLGSLGTAGLRLGVATSKRNDSAERVLVHAGLRAQFVTVVGSLPDDSRPTKATQIAAALAELGVEDPGQAVMVGDREHDAEGAHAVGTRFVGVDWGFGSRDELTAAGAALVVASPTALARAILDGAGGAVT